MGKYYTWSPTEEIEDLSSSLQQANDCIGELRYVNGKLRERLAKANAQLLVRKIDDENFYDWLDYATE